jgi:ABC-type branched-subunit amino acid transport system ATPase component/MFS family permease
VAVTREALVTRARQDLGLEPSAPVGATVVDERSAASPLLYPVSALCLFGAVDTFSGYAFAVLGPDIARSLGIGAGALAALTAAKTVAIGISPLPLAALAARGGRAALAITLAALWAVTGAAVGLTTALVALTVILIIDGLTTGGVSALHQPMLLDLTPPARRVRVLGTYQASIAAGSVIAPLMVTVITTGLGFSWRMVFLTIGALAVASTLYGLGLRDSPKATNALSPNEIERNALSPDETRRNEPAASATTTWRFSEAIRRVMLVTTVRRLLASNAVFGVCLVPYQTFLFFFLEDRWNFDAGDRGLFLAATSALTIVSMVWATRWGTRQFQTRPRRMLIIASIWSAVGVVMVVSGVLINNVWAMTAAVAVGMAVFSASQPITTAALLNVVPPEVRSHTSALSTMALGAVGGLTGAIFLSGIERRFGLGATMVVLAIPGLISAALQAHSANSLEGDLNALVDATVDARLWRDQRASGTVMPTLDVRQVHFSYGSTDILRGIDLCVQPGEIVGLLGTNGAGKSTLYRVICGLEVPTNGSIALDGHDITYHDPIRRARAGIMMVPGGRSVFSQLTIDEHRIVSEASGVDNSWAPWMERFGFLRDQATVRAGQLSGGQQQIVGLVRALANPPKLLLIDELSIGLAPAVVADLLGLVRQLRDSGTSVIIIEQSVNVAASLCDRLVFLDHGQVRFDGAASDLRERTDLLRAVFLGSPP